MIAANAPLQIFDEIDSTNAEARRRAERGDAGPIYLLARAQSAGRGRRGRVWQGLEGNLFLTYLGATSRPPPEIAMLGFAAGLALAEFCEALVGPDIVTLKWPNDLMLRGRKAAGLLLETGVMGDGRNWFAIGLGLNLAAAPETDQPTIALTQFLPNAPAPEIAARDLAPRLAAWASVLETEGFATLRRAWMDRAYGLGAPAKVYLGSQILEGAMRGLSPEGALLLSMANGEMRTVAAGDIHFPTPETA
jgi:BirA family biotin operon repressor/biotin-[acetyl-CoA-carboxylase] ligase